MNVLFCDEWCRMSGELLGMHGQRHRHSLHLQPMQIQLRLQSRRRNMQPSVSANFRRIFYLS